MKARIALLFLVLCGMGRAQLPDLPLPSGSATEIAAFLSSNEYYPLPGDVFTLTMVSLLPVNGLSGSSSSGGRTDYTLVMGRDYRLNIPLTGMLDAKGLSFEKLRQAVIASVTSKIPVDFIEISLTVPTRFQVFVSGMVAKPGPISVSSLHKVSDIIALAGGLKAGGTVRSVSLQRADGKIQQIDLLGYFRTGELAYNPLLRPGDKVNVAMAGKVVRIEGAVLNPGSYEMLEGEGLDRLLSMANGMVPGALGEKARIVRRKEGGEYENIPVNLGKDGALALASGDLVRVPSRDENPQVVMVEGAFYGKKQDSSGIISYPTAPVEIPVTGSDGATMKTVTLPVPVKLSLPWYPGMNLYDVMEQFGGPTPFAIAGQSRIFRGDGSPATAFDPIALWKNPDEGRKLMIQPGDYVYVPMKNQVVVVGGEVNLPRAIPFLANRTAADYVALAGGFSPDGSKSRLTLYDSLGRKVKKVGLDYPVQPEDILIVEPNGWALFNRFWNKPGPIAATKDVLGFANTIMGVPVNVRAVYDAGKDWLW